MVRPKLPDAERLSQPIYVLLTKKEFRLARKLSRRKKISMGAILRNAFRKVHKEEAP